MMRILHFIASLFRFSVPDLVRGVFALGDVIAALFATLMMLSQYGQDIRSGVVIAIIAGVLVIRAKLAWKKAYPKQKPVGVLPRIVGLRIVATLLLVALATLVLFNVFLAAL